MMDKQISGHTKLTGLFASPAAHSISPLIYNAAFAKLALDCVYLAFDVAKPELPQALQSMRTLDMPWANLSMPNKQIACAYMDELSPAAELIGAVNTIVQKSGKLIGHNTDGIGFMSSIADLKVQIIGKKMTILGGGGAATAIIVQAALDGVAEIAVYNRKDEFYPVIAENLARITQQVACNIQLHDLSDEAALARDLAESTLLANATKVGMQPFAEQCPLNNLSLLRPELMVADIIYNPRETKLLQAAKAAGCQTMNGLHMLLFQGVAAFKLGTGLDMPVAEIKPLVENA